MMGQPMEEGWKLAFKVASVGVLPFIGLLVTLAVWKGDTDRRLATVEIVATENRTSRDELKDEMRKLTTAVQITAARLADLVDRIDRREAERQRRSPAP